jgi:hypothetical protein
VTFISEDSLEYSRGTTLLTATLWLKPMKYVPEDINYYNNTGYSEQNTNYPSSETEEQTKKPDDKNKDNNSPQDIMKHDKYSFANRKI